MGNRSGSGAIWAAVLATALAGTAGCGGDDDGDGGDGDPQGQANLQLSFDGTIDAVPPQATTSFTVRVDNIGDEIASGMFAKEVGLGGAFAYSGSFPGENGNCFDSLEPGGTCTLELEFAPQERGLYEADIVVGYRSVAESKEASLMVEAESLGSLYTLSQVTPPQGSFEGGYRVVLDGEGLSGDLLIFFGSEECTDVDDSLAPDSLECTVPVYDFAEPVDVFLDGPGGGFVLDDAFTFMGSPFGNGRDGDFESAGFDIGWGASGFVEALSADDGKHMTLVNDQTFGFGTGREMLWVVQSAASPTACGGGLDVGDYGFVRVRDHVNGAELELTEDITGGQFASLNNGAIGDPDDGADCVIQVRQVKNFRNVTVDTTTSKSVGGETLVAFRVSGVFEATGSVDNGTNLHISTGLRGHFGGAAAPNGAPGQGNRGPSTDVSGTANSTGGGHLDGATGGGGGNGGAGGDGGGGGFGGLTASCPSGDCMFLGGGGGGGENIACGTAGGRGGGALWAFIRETSGNIELSSDAGGSAQQACGGGGGSAGSVYFHVETVGPGELNLGATGWRGLGPGLGGGGGGGGRIRGSYCTANGTVVARANGGTGGSGSSGSGGGGGGGVIDIDYDTGAPTTFVLPGAGGADGGGAADGAEGIATVSQVDCD